MRALIALRWSQYFGRNTEQARYSPCASPMAVLRAARTGRSEWVMVLLRIETDQTRSEFAGEDFDERKGFAKEFIPAGDLTDAGFFEVGSR